jgi:hypothetical protein
VDAMRDNPFAPLRSSDPQDFIRKARMIKLAAWALNKKRGQHCCQL